MMLGLYKDFYCFYILINLQQAYKGSTEVLGFVVGRSRLTATSVSHLTGNTGTTSLERYLVGNCHFIEKAEYLLANGCL